MNIACVQLKARPTMGLAGEYAMALLARRSSFGYDPFHPQVWDVPTWAVPILQHMKAPRLVLADRTDSLYGYDIIFGSVMACNKGRWERIVSRYPGTKFFLGGYTTPIPRANVAWCLHPYDAIVALEEAEPGFGPLHPLDPFYYPVLGKVANGVRVSMSTGCDHACSFCSVRHPTQELSWGDIMLQIAPLLGRKVGIVYVDDKTFGQASGWRDLQKVKDAIRPAGFVVQTTALQVTQMGAERMAEWAHMGIMAVEIGVESYNDLILAHYRKPARERLIDQAMGLVAGAGMLVCPNLLVGLAGETKLTYEHTCKWMESVPSLGWFNLYCLAYYSPHAQAQDDDEAKPIKSWHTEQEAADAYCGFTWLYNRAIRQMGG